MNTRQGGDPVAAVREDEAEGETALIFSDIRSALGTSSVNLIWRHLATLPGALPWCWQAISPLFEGGALDDAARTFRQNGKRLALPEMPPAARRSLGLSEDDWQLISSTLRGYYVSCTMNLLSLNALLLTMKAPQPERRSSAAPAEPVGRQRPIEPMVRLLDPAEMPAHCSELAWRLNALGERSDGRILISLYRYLANWPVFLGTTWALLAPIAQTGRLDLAVTEGLADADVHARQLALKANPPATALDPETQRLVVAVLEEFGRNVIAKAIPITQALMIVVGTEADPPAGR
jgi:hypothetical protein